MSRWGPNMAAKLTSPPIKNKSGNWLQSLPEKFAVAAATALGTFMITTGVPAINDQVFKHANSTTLSEQSVAFQREMWKENDRCPVDPTSAIWHPSDRGRKIDATICPETGDIAVTMRGANGRIVQGFIDLSDLKGQFDVKPDQFASAFNGIFIGTASASVSEKTTPSVGNRILLAQAVLCQLFLPDGRGLRRRLILGPNQCVEILIDTYTGRVVSQRPIPCVPNCAVNV